MRYLVATRSGAEGVAPGRSGRRRATRPSYRFTEEPRRGASAATGAGVVLLAAAFAVGLTAFFYQRLAVSHEQTPGFAEAPVARVAATAAGAERQLPAGTGLTVLVDSYREGDHSARAVHALTTWLEASGHRVYYEHLDFGADGRWWRVLAGTYAEHDYETASWDAARLKAAAPVLQARVITVAGERKR